MTDAKLPDIAWDYRGLVPAVVQDAQSGQVLMVAYMNRQSLERTLTTRQAHFWSRGRQELWHKGATSGNVQDVVEIRYDCDADTLLLRVEPRGPACHTGQTSCFYRRLDGAEPSGAPAEAVPAQPIIVDELFAVIKQRQANLPEGSYTARLFAAGRDEIVKKLGEEAIEVVVAAKGQGSRRVAEESADLVYHLLVLLADCGLEPADVWSELAKRRK
jgi:phosphoribosyl-AMP cyclohydrolase / phosphoribosyl-ATP pyrophosphohydrolase